MIIVGFSLIGLTTWFFSSRPRLMIKMLASKEDYRRAVRMTRNPDFTKGMRVIACAQIGMGFVCALFERWMRS